MSELNNVKRISVEFRRLASDLLNSRDSNVDANMYRFNEYIHNEPIIYNIIQDKIKDIEIDFSKCFPIYSRDWSEINIPKDKAKHIKAIFDLITYIAANEKNVMSIAFNYYCSSRNINDIIQNFLNVTIKPLVDYIVDELSKEMIMAEERMPDVNISGVQGSTISIAYKSNQKINSSISMINESVISLIDDINEELKKSQIDSVEKEEVIDDLDVIKEQIQNNIEKPTRLKKAYNNIVKFLAKSTKIVNMTTALTEGVQKIIEVIRPIIEGIS